MSDNGIDKKHLFMTMTKEILYNEFSFSKRDLDRFDRVFEKTLEAVGKRYETELDRIGNKQQLNRFEAY